MFDVNEVLEDQREGVLWSDAEAAQRVLNGGSDG